MDDIKKEKVDTISFVSAQVLFPMIRGILAEGKQASFIVTGMSMWPFLCHKRDQVVLDICEENNLKIGDIVLFQTQGGNYLLHRVTDLRDDCFQSTGDGNPFRDGWFSRDRIIGKVIRFVRNGESIDCGSQRYRMLCQLWMFLFPIRNWIFAFWFGIRKYIRR